MPVLKLTIKSPVGDFSGDLTPKAESENDCIQGRDKLQAAWPDLRYPEARDSDSGQGA